MIYRICVEVDLEKCLREAINIVVDSWMHIQREYYDQLLFKCKSCHEYGHFAKNCSKIQEKEMEKGKKKGQK